MAASAFVLGTLLALTPQTGAHNDLKYRIITNLKFENADVREAYKYLGKTVNAKIEVAPSIQGAVTLQLTNVTFDSALAVISRQVDAKYEYVKDGVKITQNQPAFGSAGMAPTPEEIAKAKLITDFLKSKRADRFSYQGQDLGEAIGALLRSANVPHIVLVNHKMPIQAELKDAEVLPMLEMLSANHHLIVEFLPGSNGKTLLVRSNPSPKSANISHF